MTEESGLIMRFHKYAEACQSVPVHTGWLRLPRQRKIQIYLASFLKKA